MKSLKVQQIVSSMNFDWKNYLGPLKKVDEELIEVKKSLQIDNNIEKVEEKFTAVLIYSRLEAEKKIGGKLFRYDSKEAKDIHFGLIRRVKKNSYVEI